MSDLVTEYINRFDGNIKSKLTQMRNLIHQAAPEAIEKMSYQMPTFFLNGNLVHFAAQKNHLGFYPSSEGIEPFEDKLAQFKHSKGAIQFPYDSPLPDKLITEIVSYRVLQNQKR